MSLVDQKDQVYEDWNSGLTSGQIAEKYRTTRNAVVGFIYRSRKQGVALRGDNRPRGTSSIWKPPKARKIGKPSLPKLVPPPVPPVHKKKKVKTQPMDKRWVPLWQTGEKTCRFINDDGMYCNEYTSRGSWCDEHHGRMTQPLKR